MTDHISKTRPDLWKKAVDTVNRFLDLYHHPDRDDLIEAIANALLEAEEAQRERDARIEDAQRERDALIVERHLDFASWDGNNEAILDIASAIRKGDK